MADTPVPSKDQLDAIIEKLCRCTTLVYQGDDCKSLNRALDKVCDGVGLVVKELRAMRTAHEPCSDRVTRAIQARYTELSDEECQDWKKWMQLAQNAVATLGDLAEMRAAQPPPDVRSMRVLLEDAERIVSAFARKNPRWKDTTGLTQDPWGAHAWLERYSGLTKGEG